MAQSSVEFTFKPEDSARIPDILCEGAALLLLLGRRGIIQAVGERLRIRRQGGYSGLDVWLLLWLYFASGAGMGVRAFWRVLRPCQALLAALVGRRRLISPASLSRALGAVEEDLLREQAMWLLTGVTEVGDVLDHPAVQTYDANGEGWHVFDVDPTVTTLRHRALPEGEELPEPRRRSEDTGAPGYRGRKRGDIQFRRSTVQHAGSGVWVHAHLTEGNGEGVVEFARALDGIVETCERLGHPRSRVQVRMDGEYGNVPWFTACRERNLPFVTRLNRTKLFEDPDVLAQLRAATWHRVPSSGCAPDRAAADLGLVTVAPGRDTTRPDGGSYEPITVRVVASIFPKSGKAGRGRVVDGWQVEFFAVDLPADAWPAPDAVTAYFGRTGQENRFAQEDRELGLDRIVSYHLPGQELATLVGLSVWNLRIARGFELDRPPADRPVQQLRQVQVDERVPASWPRDPVVLEILAELEWDALLARRPGWTWDGSAAELRCPEGRPLQLTTVRPSGHKNGRTHVIFRRPAGGCEDCTSRPGCLNSAQSSASKHAEFSIPTEIADRLRERLLLVRGEDGGGFPIEDIPVSSGPRAIADALFLPARARHTFRECFAGATLRIEVELPPPEAPRPRLVAMDLSDRQRRRRTWQQNVDRYALAEGAKVRVEVAGGSTLRSMLGERPRRKAGLGGDA